jgi:hypothetical protein
MGLTFGAAAGTINNDTILAAHQEAKRAHCGVLITSNTNGPVTYSLCGVHSKHPRSLSVHFQSPNHKYVWNVVLSYGKHSTGFETGDLQRQMNAALQSFTRPSGGTIP